MMKKNLLLKLIIPTLLLPATVPFAHAAKYKKEYSVSTVLSNDFPWGKVADKWSELVKERSDGKINIKVFPNVQLVNGDQTQEFSAMRSGLIDFAIGSTINWSPQVPELNLFSLPFFIQDTKSLDAITSGEAGKIIFKKIEKRGVVPIAWAENGFRELSNSKLPITKPEDLAGLKIRVVGSPLFLDTFTALGANPTQMSWSDAKPALATGAVDGQENPISVYDIARIDSVDQKYLTLWNYMIDPLIFASNRRVWESFSDEDKTLLKQAAIDAGKWEIELSRKEDIERLEKIKERKVEITTLTPEQKDAFKTATQSVYKKWTPKIGKDLINQATSDMAK